MRAVSRAIMAALSDRPVRILDWQETNSSFFQAVQVERNVMFLILTLIILVAAFNIVSSLIMLVKDKTQDIAILRTMGATRGAVMRIFLLCGATIGISGTAIGFVVGVVFCWNIESIRQAIQTLSGTELFSPEVYFLTRLPAVLDWGRWRRWWPWGLACPSPLRCIRRGRRRGRIRWWRYAMAEPVLRLVALERRYRTEAGELPVLRGADLDLHPGEIVALVAPSGSGKSTLLHLAGLLERPDGGEVVVEGRAAGTLPDDARTAIRRRTIGFVYQFHHLLPEFTAEENVILPQMADGRPRAEGSGACAGVAVAPRPRAAAAPPAGAAVGWGAAAGSDCPRAGQCAARAAGG